MCQNRIASSRNVLLSTASKTDVSDVMLQIQLYVATHFLT